MPQIELADHLFAQPERRATKAGFASVDDYIAEIVTDDLHEENFDHQFSPERLAELDRIASEINQGAKTHSTQAVREHFASKRTKWQRKQAS